MGTIPEGGNAKSGDNGSVYFYDDDDAAKAIMASMVRLEAKRAQAAQQVLAQLSQGSETEGLITVPVVTAIILGISAAATAVGAAAATTSAGVGVARLAGAGDTNGRASLEVLLENRTATPVVLQSYATNDAGCAAMPAPMAPGQGDTATIVSGSNGWTGSPVELTFLVGGGVNDDGEALTPIQAVCTLEYTGSNWLPSISIDGCNTVQASDKAQAFAAFFSSTDPRALDFTIATLGLKNNGTEAWFYFLPGSSTLDS